MTVFVDVRAPLAVVWMAAADLANHGQWMGDVESIEFDSGIHEGPGTTMRVATKIGPLRTTDVMVVTAWEPNHRIAVEHRGLFTGQGEFALSAVGGATRFTWTEEVAFPWHFGGPIGAALARPILASIWRRNLRRFKQLVEGPSPRT